jgi:hypothetical protein
MRLPRLSLPLSCGQADPPTVIRHRLQPRLADPAAPFDARNALVTARRRPAADGHNSAEATPQGEAAILNQQSPASRAIVGRCRPQTDHQLLPFTDAAGPPETKGHDLVVDPETCQAMDLGAAPESDEAVV